MGFESFCPENKTEFLSLFNLHLEYLSSLSQIDNNYYAFPTQLERENRIFFDSLYHKNTYCIYYKNENNDIVGYLLSYPCKTDDEEHYIARKYAFIDEIYVVPEFRNKSLAKQMILYAKKHFKKLGYNKIELFVLSKNNIAKKAYENCGFSIQSIIMECML